MPVKAEWKCVEKWKVVLNKYLQGMCGAENNL